MTWRLPGPEDRTLGRVLRRQAGVIGDRPFLLDGDLRLSFHEVNGQVNEIAGGLRSARVDGGDAVACFLDNSVDVVLLNLALAKLGAVFVPTNTDFHGEFLLRTFTHGAARTLVVEQHLVRHVAALWDSYHFDRVIVRGEADEARRLLTGALVQPFDDLRVGTSDEPPEVDDVQPTDLAAVMWTSGTTGPPKGVMQSHHLWVVDSDFMFRCRDGQADDVLYSCLPFYQSGAWLTGIYPALLAGLPVGMDPRFSVTDFWDRCRFYGATQMLTLGAMHMFLWQAPERPDDADNPVRVAACVPLPPAIHEPFKARFGIEFIPQAYGQSECMPVSMTNRSRSWKPGSTGVARDGIEVRIVDDDDRAVPPDSPGEICVRPTEPGTIFDGFYRDDAATVKSWRNLWYHTGDLGRVDEDGEIFFVDRKADFMRHKGRNVSSFEVESIAVRHPEIAEAAAHGVPSEHLDTEDEIKLCVVLAPGAAISEADIVEYVREHAPRFMVPRYVEICAELPHTPTGRVQKYLLRARGLTPNTWDSASDKVGAG